MRSTLPVRIPHLSDGASSAARQIAEDYSVWAGSLRDFLKHEAARLKVGPTAIRRVLVILGMIAVRSGKGPRYRGADGAMPSGRNPGDGRENR